MPKLGMSRVGKAVSVSMSLPTISDESAATILVVEDEFLIRFMVSDELRDAGLCVVEAYNADEALEIVHSGLTMPRRTSNLARHWRHGASAAGWWRATRAHCPIEPIGWRKATIKFCLA